MFSNYLKIAVRNILKNKAVSVINIMGLAIGIASAVLISHYVRFERSYETIYSNSEDIVRITVDLYNGPEFIETDCETYQRIGPQLKEQWPEVRDYVRFMGMETVQVRVKDRKFYEKTLYFADPSAFSIFNYDIIAGDPAKSFDQPRKVVVTESTANKYFSTTDVVGKTMEFSGANEDFEIVGVIADIPQNTHLKFDMLISHETVPTLFSWYENNLWNANNEYTYLLLQPGVNLTDFNNKLEAYTKDIKEIEDEMFTAEWIKGIHLYSNKTFEPEVNGSGQSVNFMAIIAIFIIILAWVNYINLSTARATERAREVGIRKAVGSNKMQLIKQFLLESFIVNIISATIAYTLVQLSIPLFRELTGQALPMSLTMDVTIWLIFSVIIFIGTCFSGIYPALIMSSFKPATVLKGKFRSSSKGNLLRKGLVVFQFLVTVVLVTVSIGVYNQIQFLTNKKLGVSIDNTLVVRYAQETGNDSITWVKSNVLEAKIADLAQVTTVARSGSLPGAALSDMGTNSSVKRLGEDENKGSGNYYIYSIDNNYLEALSINLLAGTNYDEGKNLDKLIINERASEILGFASPEDAIGKRLDMIRRKDGEPNEVIGVIENYHQRSPKEEHIPMILPPTRVGSYFLIKLESQNTRQVVASVEDIWDEIYPDTAFDFFFLDDQYNQQYVNEERFADVTSLFTILSIIIAAMGLFGLSSFTILQRTKEIGIRKALGASVRGIVGLLSKDFLKLVLISGILAIPIAYKLMDLWLTNYASHISIEWWLFGIPIVFILLIAALTVVGQTVKSALDNPVNSLRYE